MNGKFEQKYGLTWKDMDTDSRMMAIMSELFDLRESIEPLSGSCKTVDRHSLYWRVFIWAVGISLAGLVGWIIQKALT